MSVQSNMNELNNRRTLIELQGGQEAIDRVKTDGKLTSRERINMLLDEYSFVEIGAFVTSRATDFNINTKELPADGVVTGYGTINSRLVYVYSQDETILGGAIGEMHAKKIVDLYDLAIKTGAPIIGFINTAGIRLQEATDALHGFGQIYVKQSMASGVIPQITAIMGSCGGGASILTSLSDFTFMTTKHGCLYVNSPNTFDDTKDDFETFVSATHHSEETGLVDVICETDENVLAEIRNLVDVLPSNNREDAPFIEVTDDLNRISDDLYLDMEKGIHGLSIISNIVDDSKIIELKPKFGVEISTCLAKMNGITVGIIANNTNMKSEGRLTVKGLNKTENFVKFCDSFGIPIITLTDIVGFSTSYKEENAGLAKSIARLTHTFISASVPKINVILNRGYGSAYVAFNSKHIGADVVLAWPSATISTMEEDKAVRIMYSEEISKGNAADIIASKKIEFSKKQGSVYVAAQRGYVDDIIEPGATRKRVIVALEMLYTKSVYHVDRKHSSL